MTADNVTVPAVDLERLVRLAHQINWDVAVVAIPETPYECTCGLRLAPAPLPAAEDDDDDGLRLLSMHLGAAARAKHAEHLAYHVRQALAGRIEFP